MTRLQHGPAGAIRTAEAIIKATLGVQYVFFFGYMVLLALRTPCAPNTAIWYARGMRRDPPHAAVWSEAASSSVCVVCLRHVPDPPCPRFTYLPGFLSYALKWPADGGTASRVTAPNSSGVRRHASS